MEGVLTQYYDNTPRAITRKWKTVLEKYDGLKFVEYKFLPGVQNMKVGKKSKFDPSPMLTIQ